MELRHRDTARAETGTFAATCVGSGLFIASFLLICMPTPSLGTGFADIQDLVPSRIAFYIALVAATALAVALRGCIAPARDHLPLVAVAVAIKFAFGFGYPLVAVGHLPDAALTVDFLFQALTIPYLGLVWTEAYALLPEKRTAPCTLATLAVAVAAFALLQLMPSGIAAVLMHLLPLATPLAIPLLRGASQPGTAEGAAPAAVEPKSGALGGRPSWQFLVATFCALAASNILAGSAESGGFVLRATIAVSYAATLLVVAVALAVCARTPATPRHAAIAIVGALAMCYAASGLAWGNRDGIGVVESAVHHGITFSMELAVCAVVWVVLLSEARGSADAFRTAGLGLLAVNGGKAVGSVAGMLAPLEPATLSIIALVLFVPAMFFYAADIYLPKAGGILNEGSDRAEPPAAPDWDGMLDPLAAAYGLSPREREVLGLWAAGHRLDYVAEQLCVSKNTAKTHVTHIYKKTATANREELLQLIKRL